jgi:hypothetical protein
MADCISNSCTFASSLSWSTDHETLIVHSRRAHSDRTQRPAILELHARQLSTATAIDFPATKSLTSMAARIRRRQYQEQHTPVAEGEQDRETQ